MTLRNLRNNKYLSDEKIVNNSPNRNYYNIQIYIDMSTYKGVTICLSEYKLATAGVGKIAVFIYTGNENPKGILDSAVFEYVNGNGYHELIDANLDNPWMRVILTDINNMYQEDFDPAKHKLPTP